MKCSAKLAFLNMEKCVTIFVSILPRRHNENDLESKTFIQSVFLRFLEPKTDIDDSIPITLAIGISNNIYGSDIMTTYEMPHGLSKSLNGVPTYIPNDVMDDQ